MKVKVATKDELFVLVKHHLDCLEELSNLLREKHKEELTYHEVSVLDCLDHDVAYHRNKTDLETKTPSVEVEK